MTEDQKYQGIHYREKQDKPPKKGQKANANRQPRVEDAPDVDNAQRNQPPPPAPSPPPQRVRPKLSRTHKPATANPVSLADPKEQMKMVVDAPSVFETSRALAKLDAKTDDEGNYDIAFEENGFSYGADPIPPPKYPADAPNVSTEFVTPAPKNKKKDRRKEEKRVSTSEKKRKRGQEETFTSPQQDFDTPMLDAPSSVINNAGTPILNHSGLTGGLNRMMRSPSHELDESPELSRQAYNDASSPIKRTRRNGKESSGDPGLGISIKNRAERLVSSMFGGSVVSTGSNGGNEGTSRALVRTRRGSSSSVDGQLEVRKKKSHRSRNPSDAHAERKSKRKSSNPTDGDRPPRRLKQSDEHRRSDSRSPHRDSRQVTVYRQAKPPARSEDVLQREMAAHFLSLVSRDTERGCSVHKALKRFHRDFSDEHDADRGRDSGRSRADRERRSEDEKDLWRALRLRRNSRGEIVVFV
ncbi:hypothetical protein N7462_005327 [Penicillium macrosclerotiorum]|uniref:uncharacterized protein n=1 Tax=Penicillium macrosclerotiorum TaxID=303699 RepID=UPI002548B329|nr:uncharacterized protein N7462_005327 [Penicillium macrosclerotiorum]KAJ5682162.1 hypothetical protein N7462_005327 [Penicillium macrosclerotiorum]